MENLPFLADIYPESLHKQSLLYAVTIRSPIAKGRLINIEVPELPEHFTFITAKDIPGKNILFDTNIPILADDKLSYIGEPVAILLGHDKTKLEETAARCIVNAETELPSFSCTGNSADKIVCASRKIVIGDIQEKTSDAFFSDIFNTSNKIITSTFTTGIQEHWYAETIGAITYYNDSQDTDVSDEPENVLIVRTATQWPSHVKKAVSCVLGCDDQVMVLPTSLNLHMDGKLWYPSLIACHAALGTFITKSPVRMILTREEDFLYTPKRCSSTVEIASAIDENGKINAVQIDISVNLGAYGVYGQEIIDQISLGSLGFYNFKHIKVNARAVCTNIPPQGPFSGFGLSQGLFAIERHLSQIADLLEIEPAELRKNYIDTRLALPVSNHMPEKNMITGDMLIDSVTQMSDYYRKWASFDLLRQSRKTKPQEKGESLRGIGIAVGYQGNGPLYTGEDNGNYSVEVTLTKESILEIKSNITSTENYNKIWQKVAVEILSIQPDMVRIVTSNINDEKKSLSSQESFPDCGPSCSSRNITAITKLVENCCDDIRKQRFHDPLPITVKHFIQPQSGFLRSNLNWNVHDINGFLKPGFAAAVVEITIDMAECIPRIRGLWLAVDGGKIISKHRAKRSLTRSAIQALGWAYTENIEYVNGVIPKNQYENFSIFSPVDTPPIEINFISAQTDANELNEPKGIGELPFTCIPAAFMQAVSQAMDRCFRTIPLKRKDIWEMIRIRKEEVTQGHK
ncbi:MAG: xanthine dehydrogenase family protein molybdopterin-binding subunit [Treponema sp.]|nr:xanthine dehydrogenase family protein molybdopterin-binding subunit [Treponema sp.]MCL2250365.1 xanthine dehydrogenase family protein molybdopterin-binding subunit [Treponema sp.]